MERVDVAVVGAGTAGAAAALHCARRGLSVLCLEAGPLADAGARWCNGVPGWQFDAAGIARPLAPELRHDAPPVMHLVMGWGPERATFRGQDVLEVDMRLLVARLQAEAMAAGAELRGGVRVRGYADGVVRTDGDDVGARWVVDASGLHGAGLVPLPEVEAADLCTAAQQVHVIADRAGAEAWLAEQGAREHDAVCFSAVAGGYSIVNVRVSGDEVSVLTGSIPVDGVASGTQLLRDFLERHPWIGERVFGGARAIPICRPPRELHHGAVALVGDAACQVFAAHGSGIGAGMIAARMLAEALESGAGPAGYSAAWQRAWGGELAASDAFCRFSRSLDAVQLARMLRNGWLRPELTVPTLEQRPPAIGVRTVAALGAGALRDPLLAARLVPVLARMTALRVAHRIR